MTEETNPGRFSDRQADALPRALPRTLEEFLGGSSCPVAPAPPSADAPQADPPSPCPKPEEWFDLFDGEGREEDAYKLLAHASTCPA